MKKVQKERLTVTVDPALVRAADEAVKRGRATSLSAWVNAALAEYAAKERRLVALDEALAAYEARNGKFTEAELAQERLLDRKRRIVIGARSKQRRKRAA